MERSAPYALIAGFVLVGLAVAAGLLIWLTDYDPSRRETTYAVVFDDVSGLSLASEVRYNGLPVGEVASMALDPTGTGLILVEIAVLEGVPLRQGAVARLSTQGVTGVAVVALEGGDPRAPPLPEGPDGVPILTAGRGTVETLADEAPALLEEARALVEDLRAFATPENAGRVARVLADLEQGAAGLGELGALAEDLGGIGRDLAPALRGLPDALARVEGAAGEVEALAASARGLIDVEGPALASAARTAISEAGAAAEAARLRLDEAAAPIAAFTAVVGDATDTARDLSTFAHAATARVEEAEPLVADIAAATAALRSDLPTALADVRAATMSVREISAERLPILVDRADLALEAARDASARIGAAGTAARDRLDQTEPVIDILADAARAVDAASDEIATVAGIVAPAAGEVASAGTRLAGAAEAFATEAGPLAEDAKLLLQDARGAVAAARSVLSGASVILADLGRAAPNLDRTLRETAAAADAVARLARNLARDPSILIRGR